MDVLPVIAAAPTPILPTDAASAAGFGALLDGLLASVVTDAKDTATPDAEALPTDVPLAGDEPGQDMAAAATLPSVLGVPTISLATATLLPWALPATPEAAPPMTPNDAIAATPATAAVAATPTSAAVAATPASAAVAATPGDGAAAPADVTAPPTTTAAPSAAPADPSPTPVPEASRNTAAPDAPVSVTVAPLPSGTPPTAVPPGPVATPRGDAAPVADAAATPTTTRPPTAAPPDAPAPAEAGTAAVTLAATQAVPETAQAVTPPRAKATRAAKESAAEPPAATEATPVPLREVAMPSPATIVPRAAPIAEPATRPTILPVEAPSGATAEASGPTRHPIAAEMPAPAAFATAALVTPSDAPPPPAEARPAPVAWPARQVAPFAVSLALGGDDRISLTLDPAELGRVEVEIERRGAEQHISLRAERAETLALLQRDRGELERALASTGFGGDAEGRAPTLSFSLGGEGAARDQRQRPERGALRIAASEPVAAPAAPDAARGLLDLAI